jgi:AraC-like DNA-binding protein
MHFDPAGIKGLKFYGEWKSSKKPRSLRRHKNDGLEIVLISKGELTWVIEDREVQLKANTLFYTLPWQEHGGVEEMQPNCEISYLCIALAESYVRPRRRFRFHPSLGFLPGEERSLSSAFTGHPTQVIAAGDPVAWLLAHFMEIASEPSRFRHSLLRDAIKVMIVSLAKMAAAGRTTESRLFEAERRVREFTGTLVRRHAEPWTLESMSDSCRLGRTQFAQLMKTRTGDTPMTYLNRVRIREAQRLLGATEFSITEIALATGFSSSQYFATVFKEFTELNARDYRARSAKKRG